MKMGVYIPNLKMPESCFDCPISHPAFGGLCVAVLGCPLNGGTISALFCEEKRLENCPLVPVPPHGRLIDADALMQNAEYKGTHDILTAWDVVAAPTIIPAEEGE